MAYRQPFEGSYEITQAYGEKVTSAFHTGIDYGTPVGTPILASEAGTVAFSGWDNTGYGNTVILQHGDGKATLYAHLQGIEAGIAVGVKVERSQVIGKSGSTGNSTGPHLHFEARTQALNYKTHFDPMSLPLTSSWEPAVGAEAKTELTGADRLGTNVTVVAPLGAKAFKPDFSSAEYFPQGTELEFTGNTVSRNGYVYCECKPPVSPVWIAVNDGDTQILKTNEN